MIPVLVLLTAAAEDRLLAVEKVLESTQNQLERIEEIVTSLTKVVG